MKRDLVVIALVVAVTILGIYQASQNKQELAMLEEQTAKLEAKTKEIESDNRDLTHELLEQIEENRELRKKLEKYERHDHLIRDKLQDNNDIDPDEAG